MKFKFHQITCMLLFVVLLAGCRQNSAAPAEEVSEAPPAEAATSTPEPTNTATPLPPPATATATNTPQPTATATATPTFTPSPVPLSEVTISVVDDVLGEPLGGAVVQLSGSDIRTMIEVADVGGEATFKELAAETTYTVAAKLNWYLDSVTTVDASEGSNEIEMALTFDGVALRDAIVDSRSTMETLDSLLENISEDPVEWCRDYIGNIIAINTWRNSVNSIPVVPPSWQEVHADFFSVTDNLVTVNAGVGGGCDSGEPPSEAAYNSARQALDTGFEHLDLAIEAASVLLEQ